MELCWWWSWWASIPKQITLKLCLQKYLHNRQNFLKVRIFHLCLSRKTADRHILEFCCKILQKIIFTDISSLLINKLYELSHFPKYLRYIVEGVNNNQTKCYKKYNPRRYHICGDEEADPWHHDKNSGWQVYIQQVGRNAARELYFHSIHRIVTWKYLKYSYCIIW